LFGPSVMDITISSTEVGLLGTPCRAPLESDECARQSPSLIALFSHAEMRLGLCLLSLSAVAVPSLYLDCVDGGWNAKGGKFILREVANGRVSL